jgi:hypothetical protein
MELKEPKEHFKKIIDEQNNRPIPEFEGYSPVEMNQILHFTFDSKSPISLQKLSEPDYYKIPLLTQIKHLMELIKDHNEIKLTKTGNLPPKLVIEIYEKGDLKDYVIEKNISKLSKETDSVTVHLTKILTELSGLAKKRLGKLSLTKSSKKTLSDNHELLKTVLQTFTTKFNWAYFDGYGENQIGQLGFGFSIILLSKYGNVKHLDSFYSEKYFQAFPMLLKEIEPLHRTSEHYASRCYSLRTFERFMDYFGLIQIEEDHKGFDTKRYIRTTDLFRRLIKCTPHNKT